MIEFRIGHKIPVLPTRGLWRWFFRKANWIKEREWVELMEDALGKGLHTIQVLRTNGEVRFIYGFNIAWKEYQENSQAKSS